MAPPKQGNTVFVIKTLTSSNSRNVGLVHKTKSGFTKKELALAPGHLDQLLLSAAMPRDDTENPCNACEKKRVFLIRLIKDTGFLQQIADKRFKFRLSRMPDTDSQTTQSTEVPCFG